MKVVGFVGSPRIGGNTERLVKRILSGASAKGAETKMYNVAKLKISGCLDCKYCLKHEKCAIKDDMQELHKEIHESDAIIIGSPVYMFQMSGQTKLFIDRLAPLVSPDFKTRLKGRKEAILAFTQAADDVNTYKSYFDHTAKLLEFLGFHMNEIIVAGGTENRDDIEKQSNVLEKAENIGKELVK